MSSLFWEYISLEVLVTIFSYLPRRDLLACSLVCTRWKDALRAPSLWTNMVIYLDTDLMDPSTMMLTRLYYMHIKNLELAFANPQLPTRWLSYKFQEITKRACRYIIVLNDCFVQLECLKIHDWYEICRFKKIVYHLSLFLRSQLKLQKVSFCNAYLNKTDFVKMLVSCGNSEQSIQSLDLRNCYYQHEQNLLSIQIVSLVAQLQNLVVLKVNYTTLCKEVMSALLASKVKNLKNLVVFIQSDESNQTIKEESWNAIRKKCPDLKVAFHFKNISYSKALLFNLRKEIPLTVLTLTCARNVNYRDMLNKIIQNYKNSLEIFYFDIRDNEDLVDDLLLIILRNFPNLYGFQFIGVIENCELIKEIFKSQIFKLTSFEHFKGLLKNLTSYNELCLNEIYHVLSNCEIKCTVEMKIKNTRLRNAVHVYY